MKFLIYVLILSALPFLSGCATGFPNGLVYTNVTLPITASPDYAQIEASNVGRSYCTKWFGLWATGDASIEAAVNNGQAGRITTIQRIEYKAYDILGCGKYETIVYGQSKKDEETAHIK